MLTTKKRVARSAALTQGVFLLLLAVGCAPHGPRAVLDGDRLIREGKFERAIARLEQGARLLPKKAPVWNHLGLAYHHAGRATDAVKAYQQALGLDRDLAAARYNLGCLYLEQDNPALAIVELNTYTILQPKASAGWIRLGMAQLRARQLVAAENSFRQALKLNTPAPEAPEALNGLALVQMEQRRYAEAARTFSAALRQQSDYAPALLNLAIVSHHYLTNRAFALQKYRQYDALKPPPPNRAAVRATAARLEAELHPSARVLASDAVIQLASASKRPDLTVSNRTQPTATSNRPAVPFTAVPSPAPSRGTVLNGPTSMPPLPPRARLETSPLPARAGASNPVVAGGTEVTFSRSEKIDVVRLQSEEPIRPLRDVTAGVLPTSFEPDAAGIRAPSLPTARSHSTNQNIAKSTNSHRQATKYPYRGPAAPEPGDRALAERLVAEGVRAQQRGRLSDAIAAYRKAARADPSFFEAQYNLGVAAFEAGELSQALTAYESALAVKPTSIKARFNFAVALQRATYWEDAVHELEKVLAENPAEARSHFALATLYAQQLGAPQKARPHYLRLLELEPQHPQATAVRFWLEANP